MARLAGLLGWGGAPKNLVRAPRQRGTRWWASTRRLFSSLPTRPLSPASTHTGAETVLAAQGCAGVPVVSLPEGGGGGPHVGAWMVLFLSPRCVLSGVPLYVYVGACRPSARHPPRGPPMAAGTVACPTRQPARAPTGGGGPSGPRPCRRVVTTRPHPLPPLSRRRLAGVGPRHGVHSGGGASGLEGPRWPHREIPCPHPLLLPVVPTGFQPGRPPSLTEIGVLAEVQHTLWVLCS